MKPLRRRLWLLGTASTFGYLLLITRVTGHPVFLRWGFPLLDFLVVFLIFFAFLFLLAMTGAWWVFRSKADDTTALGLIIGFALLFRLLLLPTPPVLSSDIFRYIWDARIQASGLNPYLSRPADFDTEANRKDPIYQQQNRPFARTIYPPLAQMAFRVVRVAAGESITATKALMLLGDLASILILIQLLQSLRMPRGRVILYAWHPLVVFEVAGSGHVDALAIPCILLALLAWQWRRDVLAGISLGAAALIKIFPIFLLAAFFSRQRWRILIGCCGAVLLAYSPFLPSTGFQVLGHLPQFLADPNEVFNPSLIGLVLVLGPFFSRSAVAWASWIGRAALISSLAWLLRREAENVNDLVARVWVVAGAITLFTLTMHPWYLLWLLPFLAIQPRAAWIYLSGAVALSYLLYLAVPLPARVAIGAIEYLPFLILLVWQRGRFDTLTPKHAGWGAEQL